MVSTITRGVGPGAPSRRVASTPSSRGIRTSISTTSAPGHGELLQGLEAVAGLADHLRSSLASTSIRKPAADQRLVVDQEDPDAVRRRWDRIDVSHRGSSR